MPSHYDRTRGATDTRTRRRGREVPPEGELDPRYGPPERDAAGNIVRRPRPTATAILGIDPGATMAETQNEAIRRRRRRRTGEQAGNALVARMGD